MSRLVSYDDLFLVEFLLILLGLVYFIWDVILRMQWNESDIFLK
jgi:hypothetical protein